jgi:hypothetical protein
MRFLLTGHTPPAQRRIAELYDASSIRALDRWSCRRG